jgi:hypothetical protein
MRDRVAGPGQAGNDGAGPPDFGKMWEMWQDRRLRSRLRKEAFQAARAGAASKSRDEIREIYLAERNARGLQAPGDTVLDAIVDHISGNPLPAVRIAAESLVQMGKGIHALSRDFRSGG